MDRAGRSLQALSRLLAEKFRRLAEAAAQHYFCFLGATGDWLFWLVSADDRPAGSSSPCCTRQRARLRCGFAALVRRTAMTLGAVLATKLGSAADTTAVLTRLAGAHGFARNVAVMASAASRLPLGLRIATASCSRTCCARRRRRSPASSLVGSQKEGMCSREPGGQPDSDDDRCSDRGVSNPPLNVDVCSRQFSEIILLSANDAVQPLSFFAELDVFSFECGPARA